MSTLTYFCKTKNVCCIFSMTDLCVNHVQRGTCVSTFNNDETWTWCDCTRDISWGTGWCLSVCTGSYLWVCCAQSQQGKDSRGRAWERWGLHTLAGSRHSFSLWAEAFSWTLVRVCPAARSPCSTGRCLVCRVGLREATTDNLPSCMIQSSHERIQKIWPCIKVCIKVFIS